MTLNVAKELAKLRRMPVRELTPGTPMFSAKPRIAATGAKGKLDP